MVTIKEIAAECSVSVATVSNVLNGRANVGWRHERECWMLSGSRVISRIMWQEG